MSHIDISLVQRNSRTFRFRVFDSDNLPFPLTGFDAEFVVKRNTSDPDGEALAVKKSAGLPGGGTSQIEFESLAPPSGGAAVLYGIRVYLLSADSNVDVGTYVYQLDILNLATAERYTVKTGALQVLETAIKTL